MASEVKNDLRPSSFVLLGSYFQPFFPFQYTYSWVEFVLAHLLDRKIMYILITVRK